MPYGGTIIPYVGVDSLRFGMTRRQARSVINEVPSTFRRGPYADNDSDAYEELDLHLDYDSEDQLITIMGFGSNPIHYGNIALLKRVLGNVLADLAGTGLVHKYDDDGYWFHDAGFVICAAANIVIAVTVYKKGYYEEEIEKTRQMSIGG